MAFRYILAGSGAALAAMLALLAPIEIVYQLGGTYSQALLAEAAFMFVILGGLVGYARYRSK